MEYCRVCLKLPNSPVLLTQKHKKKFFQITGIELDESKDEFLCKTCLKLLLVAWKFRTEAINADEWFQKHEKSSRKEVVSDEEDFNPEVKCEILVDEEIVEAIPLQLEEDIEPQEEDYMFICDLCGAQFTTYRKIRDHIRKHRKELGRFCRFCNKVFPNRSKMTKHEKSHSITNNASSIVCEQCGRSFAELRALRMHARTHAESYKCTVPGCSDAFTVKRAFYSHFATKHGIKQPCVCVDCGNTFSNHLTLRNHRRLFHDDGIKVSCPECPKTCLNQKLLEKHIAAKHRGEKNYGCDVCENKYFQSNNLKRHYRDSHYEVYLEMVNAKFRWESMNKKPL